MGSFECSHCGEKPEMPRECKYCNDIVCSDHRLPESHDCDGVRFLSVSGKRFESKFNGTVVESKSEIKTPEPIEVEETVGSTNDVTTGDPSPDVALDGSVASSDSKAESDTSNWDSGLLAKLSNLLS